MIYLSITFALIGVLSYVFYARKYQPIMETTQYSSFISATILYLTSSTILLGLIIITSLIWQDSWNDIHVPTHIQLWTYQINQDNSAFTNIVFSITIMAFFYAFHIVLEAKARKGMDVNIYTIIFQINIIVIIVINFLFKPQIVHPYIKIASFFVLLFSILPLVYRYHSFQYKVVFTAILSAITCGIALATDGKIVDNIIFTDSKIEFVKTPLFLCYEFLTFFIPSVITFSYLSLRFGILKTIMTIRIEWKRKHKEYILAAFGSVFQFVGSVYSLGIYPNSWLPPMILATAPLMGLLAYSIFDEKTRTRKETIVDYISATGMLSSLSIIFIFK